MFLIWYILLILKLSTEVADNEEVSSIFDITGLYLNLIGHFSSSVCWFSVLSPYKQLCDTLICKFPYPMHF